MSEIEWQEPPRAWSGRKGSKWADIATTLRANPGKWALVHHGAASVAANIRDGRLTGMSQGEFEATSRKSADGKTDIYARFVGGESA